MEVEMLKPTTLKVACVLEEEMLGMTAGDPELVTAFLKNRNKGQVPENLKEQVEEEKEFLPPEEAVEKASTHFPKDAEGRPFLWNYQIRGALKDWCAGMMEIGWKGKGQKAWNPYNFKKRIDSAIFVQPRQIVIVVPEGASLGLCERPLRAETLRGPRVALARSETVPAGSTFEFDIQILRADYELAVREWLEYGSRFRGLCQWRNSGKGAFNYTTELKSE